MRLGTILTSAALLAVGCTDRCEKLEAQPLAEVQATPTEIVSRKIISAYNTTKDSTNDVENIRILGESGRVYSESGLSPGDLYGPAREVLDNNYYLLGRSLEGEGRVLESLEAYIAAGRVGGNKGEEALNTLAFNSNHNPNYFDEIAIRDQAFAERVRTQGFKIASSRYFNIGGSFDDTITQLSARYWAANGDERSKRILASLGEIEETPYPTFMRDPVPGEIFEEARSNALQRKTGPMCPREKEFVLENLN
jgi:hypothetical protein